MTGPSRANVRFAVQTHPARALLAATLAARVGGPVDVVSDPDPDNPRRSAWRTFRALLERGPSNATHVAQIQDDAVVCDGYRQAVEAAVAARPGRLLVFFVGVGSHAHSRAVMEACRRDLSWALLGLGQWVPVVATAWPRELVTDFLAWEDAQHFPEGFVSDDERVGRWCQQRRHRPLAAVPSLADHPDVVPSLLGNRWRTGRQATCFIGDGCGDCASRIDWNLGPN